MDYALMVAGSSFTVGVAEEERDTMSVTEIADAPERTHKMAATATGHIISYTHESGQVALNCHASSRITADLPESLHVSADPPELLHVSADPPESLHVSADPPEPAIKACKWIRTALALSAPLQKQCPIH